MQNNQTSKYKGVSWNSKNRMWRVKLVYKGITYIDCFAHEEKDAARLRDLIILKKSLPIDTQTLKKPE